MAVVGSYVALSKPLLAVVPVFILAGLRFTIALVAMISWLKPEPDAAPLTNKLKLALFTQSLFGNFLFSVCMLFGVAYSSATTAGIVMAGIPAAVAVLSRVILGERFNWRVGVAIVLSVAAVLCLQLGKADILTSTALTGSSSHFSVGIALLLAAVACEAIYVVMAKRLSGHVSPRRNSALLNAVGWGLTVPFALWQWGDTGFTLAALSLSHWVLLIYYALAASVISTLLWFTGLRHVPASQAGVYTVALPISAAALGVGVFGEPFLVWHGVALGLAITSVVFASRNSKKL